ncbi:hypothetical protein NIES2101_09245 [Calothrix sp. HK-06]|nr:hypothetical protein NIES2101_09245 [Calothrix sp. HK-06]
MRFTFEYNEDKVRRLVYKPLLKLEQKKIPQLKKQCFVKRSTSDINGATVFSTWEFTTLAASDTCQF